MSERTAVIGSRRGLHGRPAALLAARVSALRTASVVLARSGDPRGPWVDASSALDLLALEIGYGEAVVLRSAGRGEEEDALLRELAELLESDLDEP